MDDSCGCGCLGGLIVLSLIISVIVWILEVAAGIIAAIIGIALGIGFLVGLFYTFKCFIMALSKAKQEYIDWKGAVYNAERDSDGKLKYYEEYVPASASSYFHGAFQKNVKNLIANNFKNVFDTIKDCWSNVGVAGGLAKVPSFAKNIVTIFFLLISGAALSIVLTVLILAISLISQIIYWLMYGITILCDNIHYSVRKIESRCTNGSCKKVTKVPVYCCPKCGVPHKNLRPSKWGIFHRVCVCGEHLPCMIKGKAKPSGISKIQFKAFCPECGHTISGYSRPLGVALLGGVNSGKSTFKTAFLFDFINNSAVSHDVKIDDYSEDEFADIEKYFRGSRTVPETRPDPVRGYDVTVFNFSMENDKFSEKRTVQMYDMPGEVFETNNAQDRMEHFTYIEGLVFLLDPYSMQVVVGMAEQDGNNDMRIGKMDMDTLATRLVESLAQVPNVKKHNNKFTIPVAVCINKVDTLPLKNRIGMPAAQKLKNSHPDVFASEFDALDYLCRAFMIRNDKGNVIQTIDNNFETVHYFSCTSMGYVPKNGRRTRFQPENVSAAVNWLFSRVDKQFDAVFDEYKISDVSEDKKKLARENDSYYQEIENALSE